MVLIPIKDIALNLYYVDYIYFLTILKKLKNIVEGGKNMDTKKFEKLSIEETLKTLQTDPEKGLTEEEVRNRIKKYGRNEIPEKEESTLRRILRRFWGPIPAMIETAAILSAVVHKWGDFTIITLLLLTNAFIDFWQESKALNTLKVLKEKLAKKAIVLRNGEFKEIDARELVPGDIIKIRIGNIIPADVKILQTDYMLVDQSVLTGESLPVAKKTEDIVYSNSIAKQGEAIGIVTNTGLNTFFGNTVKLVARAEKEEKSHFQKAVIRIGNYLIILTVFLVALIILVAMFRHEHMLEIVRFSLVLTVAAIPVALPAVLTVTMAVGATYLAKKQAIVSRLAAIEELAGIDVLCSDKTGTLTKNKMTVADPVVYNGFDANKLMLYAGLASKEEDNDPIEKPIFDYLKQHKLYDELKKYKQLKFKPFDPVGKRTEALVEGPDGKQFIVTKGAPQVILELCIHSIKSEKITDPVNKFAASGYRTLGVSIKEKDDYKYVGLIPLFDPPREDSKKTIDDAKDHHVSVKMLTGDNLAIAKHIAGILGLGTDILDARDLRGGDYREYILLSEVIAKAMYQRLNPKATKEEIEIFSKDIAKDVRNYLSNIPLPEGWVKQHEAKIIELIEESNGFAQVFPEDKYFIVDKLQKAGHIVAMTGDGVNDAPALRKADAGIAVSGATDAARAAAAVVLLQPGLNVIIDAIKIARVTFERMKSYAMYRIAETLRVIFFMTLSILIFNFYPVTALMIILLAFLNDIPILAIAYDRTKINNRPVSWNMRNVITVSTVLGILGVIASFGIFYIAKVYFKLGAAAIQTFVFLKLAVAGHLTIFITRTEDRFWRKPYPSGILFWSAVATKALATLFAVYGWFISPIGWRYAIIIWVYALAWMVVNDFAKVATYRWLRREEMDRRKEMAKE